MKPKTYIVWSNRDLGLSDPWQERWYLQQVLTRGRAEDVSALDWDEARRVLPELDPPREVRRLWESQFARREPRTEA